eukprot:scaffold241_cov242-Pinguiococcus_pyrenoidosus.AAC.9
MRVTGGAMAAEDRCGVSLETLWPASRRWNAALATSTIHTIDTNSLLGSILFGRWSGGVPVPLSLGGSALLLCRGNRSIHLPHKSVQSFHDVLHRRAVDAEDDGAVFHRLHSRGRDSLRGAALTDQSRIRQDQLEAVGRGDVVDGLLATLQQHDASLGFHALQSGARETDDLALRVLRHRGDVALHHGPLQDGVLHVRDHQLESEAVNLDVVLVVDPPKLEHVDPAADELAAFLELALARRVCEARLRGDICEGPQDHNSAIRRTLLDTVRSRQQRERPEDVAIRPGEGVGDELLQLAHGRPFARAAEAHKRHHITCRRQGGDRQRETMRKRQREERSEKRSSAAHHQHHPKRGFGRDKESIGSATPSSAQQTRARRSPIHRCSGDVPPELGRRLWMSLATASAGLPSTLIS